MKFKFLLLVFLISISAGVLGQSDENKFAAALATNNISTQKKLGALIANNYSSFKYTYYKLILASLPKKAVLITNSFDDTFPLAVLQLSKGDRSDVSIISLGMLKDTNYLNHINSKHKIELERGSESKQIREIKSKLKNVRISTTVNSKIWFNSSSFLVGLTVQTGNSAQIKKLTSFYNSYKKLKLKSYSFSSSDLSIIRNILPPLITLYKLDSSIPLLKEDLLELAKMVNKSAVVEKIIAEE